MMTQSLKPGSILSESSFFVVKNLIPGKVIVTDDLGNEITIGDNYVNKVLSCADYFEKEEKKTMTELAELFISSPRIAMTVAFFEKDKEKLKRDYEAEKKAKIDEISNAKVADVPKLLNDLIENPISKIIPGKLRIMKGRHYGEVNELGRVQFIDMELPKTDPNSRLRQVDPRTIQHLIVNKVKYSLK